GHHRVAIGVASEFLAHRDAVDAQHTAEVGLHQHAHGEPAELLRQLARRGADATLPSERDGATTGPDAAFLDHPGAGRFDRADDVFGVHRTVTDRIQPTVVRLADDCV